MSNTHTQISVQTTRRPVKTYVWMVLLYGYEILRWFGHLERKKSEKLVMKLMVLGEESQNFVRLVG